MVAALAAVTGCAPDRNDLVVQHRWAISIRALSILPPERLQLKLKRRVEGGLSGSTWRVIRRIMAGSCGSMRGLVRVCKLYNRQSLWHQRSMVSKTDTRANSTSACGHFIAALQQRCIS